MSLNSNGRCKKCNKVSAKIPSGIKPNSEGRKEILYLNADGRRWDSQKCPDCANDYRKQKAVERKEKQEMANVG